MFDVFRKLCRDLGRAMQWRLRRPPIQTHQDLVDFVSTQAVYVAQTSLYGYMKTRMGSQFRELFQDDGFAQALADARDNVAMACLSDLCIFAASLCKNRPLSQEVIDLFESTTVKALGEVPAYDFADRLGSIDWDAARQGEGAFTESPTVLVAAVPVVPEYREQDREILMNSIRFRWAEVRRDLRKRLVPDASILGASLDSGGGASSE